jgi:hypothetical protein
LGYYIRVLGTNPREVPLQSLRASASPAVFDADDDGSGGWQNIVLRHEDGTEIAEIERNLVVDGDLGAEELQEFIEEVPLCQPESAARWLKDYLSRVKVIYAFRLLSGTDVNDGWSRLHSVYNAVWQAAGGILQSDGEGFSNEAGYTILWQFSETATGSWNVGVLSDGRWVYFEMDLGNSEHREAFLQGMVPAGVRLLA